MLHLTDCLLCFHQPPASGLQVYPMVIVRCFHNVKVEIIVQWLKFNSFPVNLLIPLRSGLIYVTSTLFHPLLTPGYACLGCKTYKSVDGRWLSGATPWP